MELISSYLHDKPAESDDLLPGVKYTFEYPSILGSNYEVTGIFVKYHIKALRKGDRVFAVFESLSVHQDGKYIHAGLSNLFSTDFMKNVKIATN